MTTILPDASFAKILKHNGYSITAPRRALFAVLISQESLSMRELVDHAKNTMDRASVYRTVEIFEKLGIIRRINIGWKYKLELSDTFAEHHHHLTCLTCQAVIPINEADLEAFIETASAQHNFQPAEHQVEVQGYCVRCTTRPERYRSKNSSLT